jgi:hypothetical protein
MNPGGSLSRFYVYHSGLDMAILSATARQESKLGLTERTSVPEAGE